MGENITNLQCLKPDSGVIDDNLSTCIIILGLYSFWQKCIKEIIAVCGNCGTSLILGLLKTIFPPVLLFWGNIIFGKNI